MTTAVAHPPVTASLSSPAQADQSVRSYAPIAPSSNNIMPSSTPNSRSSKASSSHSPPSQSEARFRRTVSDKEKTSPNHRLGPVPKVVVKKEPTSPENPGSRHRPSRLNLASSNITSAGPGALSSRPSAGPLTSRESGSLVMHDVGLACLSPGFNTQDPTMREQLERSMSVREQQRRIIEARAKGLKGPSDFSVPRPPDTSVPRTARHPPSSKRKGPPPGLSINAPSHEQFANERVIQSAPLHQTFTGLRQSVLPLSRQLANQSSNLSQTSHIHHIPATQTSNRLPPIADVFPSELQAPPQTATSRPHSHYPQSPGHSSHSNTQPPLPSPGFPPNSHSSYPPPLTSRPREYSSAEEAIQSMTGGREDLVPRVVHYGGHQPPTPPSPLHHSQQHKHGLGVHSASAGPATFVGDSHTPSSSQHLRSGIGGGQAAKRRRTDDEAESPPLGSLGAGKPTPIAKRMPFGEGRDSPETIRRKKERFISLCSEAWDLFHD